MNCDCIKTLGPRMAELLRPQAGDNCTAEAKHIALCIDDDMNCYSALQVPFTVKGTGRGFSRANGKEVGCNASYCPFCGRTTGRYVVGEDAGLVAAYAKQEKP